MSFTTHADTFRNIASFLEDSSSLEIINKDSYEHSQDLQVLLSMGVFNHKMLTPEFVSANPAVVKICPKKYIFQLAGAIAGITVANELFDMIISITPDEFVEAYFLAINSSVLDEERRKTHDYIFGLIVNRSGHAFIPDYSMIGLVRRAVLVHHHNKRFVDDLIDTVGMKVLVSHVSDKQSRRILMEHAANADDYFMATPVEGCDSYPPVPHRITAPGDVNRILAVYEDLSIYM